MDLLKEFKKAKSCNIDLMVKAQQSWITFRMTKCKSMSCRSCFFSYGPYLEDCYSNYINFKYSDIVEDIRNVREEFLEYKVEKYCIECPFDDVICSSYQNDKCMLRYLEEKL